jgi:hypothetical protein
LIKASSVLSKPVFPVALQAGALVAVAGGSVWVGEAVRVGVETVPSGVSVIAQVGVGVSTGEVPPAVEVGVGVREGVVVGVLEAVRVMVDVGGMVNVAVNVGVSVTVGISVGVEVAVGVAVPVAVAVDVRVAVGVAVDVGRTVSEGGGGVSVASRSQRSIAVASEVGAGKNAACIGCGWGSNPNSTAIRSSPR